VTEPMLNEEKNCI